MIEPSPLIQQGFKALLAGYPEFEWIGIFPNLHHLAENKISACSPDLILLNPMVVNYEKRLNARSMLPFPSQIPVAAIIYNYFDPETIRQYDISIDLCDDNAAIIRKLRIATENAPESSTNTDNYDLSEREKEILISVAKGLTNKEIADRHNISIHTVISHRKNITRKTGIKTVSGLTVYALLNNLLSQGEIE